MIFSTIACAHPKRRQDFLHRARIIAHEKHNFATRIAASVDSRCRQQSQAPRGAPAVHASHLLRDVAVEVPIWLTRADIAALERQHDIQLLPDGAPANQTITGHIDFLRVRNGAVHILDDKPDARTNRPFAQLTHLRPGAHPAAGLRLFDIKCLSWFNEDQYCEFFPRTVLAREKGKHSTTSAPA